ncbi:hypothetical protein OH738_40875 (plasmid) [Streptomyces hirsutus]|uniref:hypothetical protein n=1 Tax=Streptomyces hirsutus TaxID=35620 RepID=UPI00386FAA3F|nr:hypothetical protein OH738_40875 [Streptomyces hirsutus]
MVRGHGKKQRAKKRAARTGASYASAAAGTTHDHSATDTGLFEGMLPYVGGWEIDYDLATRLVSSCWAGCGPCQASLSRRVLADRATLAGLAGACYLNLVGAGVQHSAAVSPVTRAWAAKAHGKASLPDTEAALRAVAEMSEDEARELLEDTLDHWAGSGASVAAVGLADRRTDAPPRPPSGDPMDRFREAGINVLTLDDLDLPLPKDIDGVARYSVLPARTVLPDGRPFPMLSLQCETAGAGIEDLRRRTDWQSWDGREMPALDVNWRIRADIATRSLRCLVQIDTEGMDMQPHLWDAGETVPLPGHWWDLLDRAQHVLVAGPLKDTEDESALTRAADSGELLAVVARVSFS